MRLKSSHCVPFGPSKYFSYDVPTFCSPTLGQMRMSHHHNITDIRSTRRALVVLFFTSLFFFYAFGLNNVFNALEVPLSKTYGLNPLQMGWISSLYFWANVISLMPMGALVDRYSPKRVILMAMLLSAFTVWLIANSNDMPVLIISRILMGVAGGCCFVGCIRIAVNWFDLHKMARVSGFIVTMGMLGGFMVQSPLIALIDHIGWRMSLDVVAIIGVVIAILILLFVSDCPKQMEEAYHSAKTNIPLFKSFAMVLTNRQNWFSGLAGSLINLPIFMLGALWGVAYLTKVDNLNATQAGMITGMLFFGTMLGSPLAGFISDYLQRRKLPLIIGILMSVALVYVILHSPNLGYWNYLILFFLLGVTTSVQTICYPIVAESNPHAITSTATSVISMLMLLGGAISEPLFGWIVQQFGTHLADGTYTSASYRTAIEILPIAFVIAVVAALFVKETRAKRLNAEPKE